MQTRGLRLSCKARLTTDESLGWPLGERAHDFRVKRPVQLLHLEVEKMASPAVLNSLDVGERILGDFTLAERTVRYNY